MFTCTECGRCSSQCPATATGKPLAPRQLLLDLRDYLYEHQDELIDEARRRATEAAATAREPRRGRREHRRRRRDPRRRAVGAATCAAPARRRARCMIEYVDKIVDMRRHLVQEEARFPAELTRTFKGMETQSNPWGIGAEKRVDVGRRARHPDASPTSPTPSTSTTSAAPAPFDDRNKKTTQAFAKILKKAGVDFASSARRSRATATPRAASATSTSTRRWRRWLRRDLRTATA